MSKRIVFAPQDGIARGFSQMSALMASTLGPDRGVIWNAIGTGKPEALTESGVIARRVTELKGDCENTGAMIIRQAAMAMHERYLDGAAITAALAQAIFEHAHRMVAAGVNPMRMRTGIECGVEAACAAIMANAEPATTQKLLAQTALTATGDAELADVLGEMFDLLGKHGAYVVDEYAAPLLDRDYVEGGRWSARPASRELMPPAGADLTLDQPLIFVSADKIERFEQIAAAMEITASHPDKPALLILAPNISGEALQALTINHRRGKITAAAVILLSSGDAQTADLDDIAVMVGATTAANERGTAPHKARPDWFGRARQVIVKRDSLTVIGGKGERAAAQKRVSELRGQLKAIKTPDEAWERLRLRIARLSGGMGILKIGAITIQERDARKDLAKKAVRVLETALERGITAGGGVAYVNAIPHVKAMRDTLTDSETQAGIDVVAKALTAPFLQLACNAGQESAQVALHEITWRGGDTGLDVRNGEFVSMRDAGIFDSAAVLCAALHTASSAAVMALTTDIIITER